MSPVHVTASATPPSRAWKSVSNLHSLFLCFSFTLAMSVNRNCQATHSFLYLGSSQIQKEGANCLHLVFWVSLFAIGDVGLCFSDMKHHKMCPLLHFESSKSCRWAEYVLTLYSLCTNFCSWRPMNWGSVPMRRTGVRVLFGSFFCVILSVSPRSNSVSTIRLPQKTLC